MLRLLRVHQWYKNLLIFLPIIFAGKLTDIHLLSLTVVGFFSICLVFSANYIINDLKDKNEDSIHPHKRHRPIASGRIKPGAAIALAIVVLSIGLFIAYSLSNAFFLITVSLFVLTQIYTFLLKHEPFADVITIAVNFVLRTVSGAFVITTAGFSPYVEISHWLILCPFFLALLLAVSKRRYELRLLEEDATKHKAVLGSYTHEITYSLMIIATSLFLTSFALYTFFSPYPALIMTLPFVIYLVFRYYSITENQNQVINPDRIMTDKKAIVAGIISVAIVLLAIYM